MLIKFVIAAADGADKTEINLNALIEENNASASHQTTMDLEIEPVPTAEHVDHSQNDNFEELDPFDLDACFR